MKLTSKRRQLEAERYRLELDITANISALEDARALPENGRNSDKNILVGNLEAAISTAKSRLQAVETQLARHFEV